MSTAFPSFEVPNGDLNETIGFLSFGNEGWGRLYGESYGKFENDQALIHQGLQISVAKRLLDARRKPYLAISHKNHEKPEKYTFSHKQSRISKLARKLPSGPQTYDFSKVSKKIKLRRLLSESTK